MSFTYHIISPWRCPFLGFVLHIYILYTHEVCHFTMQHRKLVVLWLIPSIFSTSFPMPYKDSNSFEKYYVNIKNSVFCVVNSTYFFHRYINFTLKFSQNLNYFRNYTYLYKKGHYTNPTWVYPLLLKIFSKKFLTCVPPILVILVPVARHILQVCSFIVNGDP